MNGRELDLLMEAATTAYRERDRDGRIVPPPAWWDLPHEACDEVYLRQLVSREIERALRPDHTTTTARAVLSRILG